MLAEKLLAFFDQVKPENVDYAALKGFLEKLLVTQLVTVVIRLLYFDHFLIASIEMEKAKLMTKSVK